MKKEVKMISPEEIKTNIKNAFGVENVGGKNIHKTFNIHRIGDVVVSINTPYESFDHIVTILITSVLFGDLIILTRFVNDMINSDNKNNIDLLFLMFNISDDESAIKVWNIFLSNEFSNCHLCIGHEKSSIDDIGLDSHKNRMISSNKVLNWVCPICGNTNSLNINIDFLIKQITKIKHNFNQYINNCEKYVDMLKRDGYNIHTEVVGTAKYIYTLNNKNNYSSRNNIKIVVDHFSISGTLKISQNMDFKNVDEIDTSDDIIKDILYKNNRYPSYKIKPGYTSESMAWIIIENSNNIYVLNNSYLMNNSSIDYSDIGKWVELMSDLIKVLDGTDDDIYNYVLDKYISYCPKCGCKYSCNETIKNYCPTCCNHIKEYIMKKISDEKIIVFERTNK